MDLCEISFAGLPPLELLYVVLAVLLASLVRGYSGFGLSALVIASVAPVLPPAELVPVAMMLEVAATLVLLRQVWREVDRPLAGRLLLGAALGTPFGVAALARLPIDATRIGISLVVLAASILLWRGLRVSLKTRGGTAIGAGVLSGLVNGATGVGGLVIVLFFLSVSMRAAATRATMMIYLLLLGLYGVIVAQMEGLVTGDTWTRAALLCLPMAAGAAFGHRRFVQAEPESFRRFALVLLMVLALLGLLRVLLGPLLGI